ncbi:hypothetical protein [Streptomyces cyaneofuscatus]|uniref:hypothetical protein n=1 Tax=Streptomyces cyaneofuscatus TaxID=66883 RepID=UPI0036CBB586
MTLLQRTWVDWAVCVFMVVTAVSSKSSILVVFFTTIALTAAGIGGCKAWRMTRPAKPSA